MAYSSYQVQRMMEHLKRTRASADSEGIPPEATDQASDYAQASLPDEAAAEEVESASDPAAAVITRVVSGFDHVQLSARAIQQAAQAAALAIPLGSRRPTVTIIDDSPLPLSTRIELERRAGSFMRPPLMPSPPPMPIPRTRRRSLATDAADPLGDMMADIQGDAD